MFGLCRGLPAYSRFCPLFRIPAARYRSAAGCAALWQSAYDDIFEHQPVKVYALGEVALYKVDGVELGIVEDVRL